MPKNNIEFSAKQSSVQESPKMDERQELMQKLQHTSEWDIGREKAYTDIDYLGILDYLANNQSVPYKKPETPGLSQEEIDHFKKMKQKGKDINDEMKKIASLCGTKYGLTKCEHMSWLDGSNAKTRKYLWAQTKEKGYEGSPISVSIVAEMSDVPQKARYRVSLEIKNDNADKKQMAQYHSFLDIPLQAESPLIYVYGSNENGVPRLLDDTAENIKAGLKTGTYEKVQLSRIIEYDSKLTNDSCEADILESVEALLPYYEYVIGKTHKLEETSGEMDLTSISTPSADAEPAIFDKNLILYGPPGTGKTYHTAIYAVAICDGKPEEEVAAQPYEDTMTRYRELIEEKRVAFTTFHQSYGYEEFIEGIKPHILKDEDDASAGDLKYDIVPGVFKEFCERAKSVTVKGAAFAIPEDSVIWKVTVQSSVQEDCFDNDRVRIDWDFEADGAAGFVNDMKPGDIILTTDGSRTIINGIALVKDEDAFKLDEKTDSTTRNVTWLAKRISVDVRDINNGKVLHRKTCARVPNMKIADVAKIAIDNNPELRSTEIEENNKPYVFIIDEINRGNISKIFGELITLIEETKREGTNEGASAILPYSGEPFSVPANVYLVGTMNTADRSIALMDTALRRRFSFKEMMPDSNVLKDVVVDGLSIPKMLDTINNRIAFLFDREHTIGHAFFTGLLNAENRTVDKLADIFEKSVIPLLQEYFYEDYQKIQLVLGDNAKTDDNLKFIKDSKVVAKDIFVGSVEDIVDLPEKKFEVNKDALYDIESYKSI